MKIILAGAFILSGLIIGAGCQQTDFFREAEYVEIEGTIRDASGEVLSGITVEIEARRTVTGPEGHFRLDSLRRGEAKVMLSGGKGTGRYIVDLNRTRTTMDLEYPVITTVVLLHDNDQHFKFNFKEPFIRKVEEYRTTYENVWLLNAGDIFVRHAARWPVPHDTAWYAERSRFIIETMNEVGYDVMTPGNHEFDYIGTYTNTSLNLAEFSVITANVDVATRFLPVFDPYVILETGNGMTIAVLGISLGFNKPGVTRRDYVETAKAYLNLAEENDLFVALTHIGYSRDKLLAEEVPEFDVIIGGHSHTLLETAETVNGVLVAQAAGGSHYMDPEWPKWLGKVKVVLENDRVVEKQGHVITLDKKVNEMVEVIPAH